MKQLNNNNPNDKQEIARLFGQAPEWVNFIAFDSDGHQSWYGEKPELSLSGNTYFSDQFQNYNYNDFPFDGLHFENQTYANCLIERPRAEPDVFGQPTRFWQRFKAWRLTRQNKAAKEAASEVERLINCGK